MSHFECAEITMNQNSTKLLALVYNLNNI